MAHMRVRRTPERSSPNVAIGLRARLIVSAKDLRYDRSASATDSAGRGKTHDPRSGFETALLHLFLTEILIRATTKLADALSQLDSATSQERAEDRARHL